MATIVITSVPPGDAPENIRQAWVGIKLKIAAEKAIPQEYEVVSILTDPHSWKFKLLSRLRFKTKKVDKWMGFPIEFIPAIWELERAGRIEAAHWWVKNAPQLLRPGQTVIFPASCCRVEEQMDA